MLCGSRFGAACELPGIAFKRCPLTCVRYVGNPGRCWCEFHEKSPNVEWTSEEDRLWQRDSFRDVLAILELKGLEEYATIVLHMGITKPKHLAEVELETLWEAGWSVEHTCVLRKAEL